MTSNQTVHINMESSDTKGHGQHSLLIATFGLLSHTEEYTVTKICSLITYGLCLSVALVSPPPLFASECFIPRCFIL